MPYQVSPELLAFLKMQPARTLLAADPIQDFVDDSQITGAPADEHTNPSISILYTVFSPDSFTFELFVANSNMNRTTQLSEH
jgi:hypothetical protein